MSANPKAQIRALVPGDEIVLELRCSVVVTAITEPGDGGVMLGNMKLDFTDGEILDDAGSIRIGERIEVEHLNHHPGH